MAVKENIEEAEDFDFAEYAYKPKEITVNDRTVIDYTGIEHDKIFLVNKKDILSKPRPSWIPEFDIEGLVSDDFLPVCVKDFSDGSYYVQSKIKTGDNVFEKKYYRMSPELLTASVDYYLKYKRAKLKEKGSTQKVSLPRALKSMPHSRYLDMAELLSFCIDAEPDNKGNNPDFWRKDLKKGSVPYRMQNNIIFLKQWQPLLQAIKDKKLDMNLQKQDYINTFDKGEETSYGKSNRFNSLYENFGIKIKKQNGSTFSQGEKDRLSKAVDKVWNHYGPLREFASEKDLTVSYADNCNQHARKSCGLYRTVPSTDEKAIGISFFDDEKKSFPPDVILSHETAHWLDSEKGKETHHFFASDIEGTLENKIALKFKNLIRENNGRSLKQGFTQKLSDYLARTCECLARAMEEYYALENGLDIFEKNIAYLPKEQFNKEIAPMAESLIEENRKHFSLEYETPVKKEQNNSADIEQFETALEKNTNREYEQQSLFSETDLNAEEKKTVPSVTVPVTDETRVFTVNNLPLSASDRVDFLSGITTQTVKDKYGIKENLEKNGMKPVCFIYEGRGYLGPSVYESFVCKKDDDSGYKYMMVPHNEDFYRGVDKLIISEKTYPDYKECQDALIKELVLTKNYRNYTIEFKNSIEENALHSDTDTQALNRLGFYEVSDKKEIKKTVDAFKNLKLEMSSVYDRMDYENCKIYKSDGNVPSGSEHRKGYFNDDMPLYIIRYDEKYAVMQDKFQHDPGKNFYHDEYFPSLLSLLLTLGSKTNLSEEESRKTLMVKVPGSNIQITAEQLLSLDLLSDSDKDFYRNHKSDNFFFRSLKKLINDNTISENVSEHAEAASKKTFEERFKNGDFDNIFHKLGDSNFRHLGRSLYDDVHYEEIKSLWIELFSDGVPESVRKLEEQWYEKIERGNFKALDFKESYKKEAAGADDEKLLRFYSSLKKYSHEEGIEHNDYLFMIQVINCMGKNTDLHYEPLSGFHFYFEPDLAAKKEITRQVVEDELEKRGLMNYAYGWLSDELVELNDEIRAEGHIDVIFKTLEEATAFSKLDLEKNKSIKNISKTVKPVTVKFNFEKNIAEEISTENTEEKKSMKEKPYTFIVKDTGEFTEDFEPVTGLTAEEAVDTYIKLRDKGYYPGFTFHVPGDLIFGEHAELGAVIALSHDDKINFKIMGDTFINQLKNADDRSRNYIDAYKELYEAISKKGIPVETPQFVYDKEGELFNSRDYIEEHYPDYEHSSSVNLSNDIAAYLDNGSILSGEVDTIEKFNEAFHFDFKDNEQLEEYGKQIDEALFQCAKAFANNDRSKDILLWQAEHLNFNDKIFTVEDINKILSNIDSNKSYIKNQISEKVKRLSDINDIQEYVDNGFGIFTDIEDIKTVFNSDNTEYGLWETPEDALLRRFMTCSYADSQMELYDISKVVMNFMIDCSKEVLDARKAAIDTISENLVVNSPEEQFKKNKTPYVKLNWSESSVFPEDNKVYSVKDFNELLFNADKEFYEKKQYAEKKYGSIQNYLKLEKEGRLPDEDKNIHFGYDKTDFKFFNIPDPDNPGDTFSYAPSRYDIGDGEGSVFDFVRSTCSHDVFIKALDKLEIELYFHEITDDQQKDVKNIIEQESKKLSGNLKEKLNALDAAPVKDSLTAIKDTYEFSMKNAFDRILEKYPFASKPSVKDSQFLKFAANEVKKMIISELHLPYRLAQKSGNEKDFTAYNSTDWDKVRKIYSLFPANVNMTDYIENILQEKCNEKGFSVSQVEEIENPELNILKEQERQREFVLNSTAPENRYIAPNGEKSLLSKQQWLDVRTPNFKRNFGNWNYNENKKVTIIALDTSDLPFDYQNIQELKSWLKDNLIGTSVQIKSDGQYVKFNSRTTKDSLKRRGEEHRNAYSVLTDLIEKSEYFDFENVDGQAKHGHLKGQDIYYSALKVGEKLYSVRIKIDVSKDNLEGAYKAHKISEINIAPNLYHSQSNNNDLYADIGASIISLGLLTDFVKPKKLMTLNANEEPSLKEIQDKLNSENSITNNLTDEERKLFSNIFNNVDRHNSITELTQDTEKTNDYSNKNENEKLPNVLFHKLSTRTKVWFYGENKTVKDMLDYIIKKKGADFDVREYVDGTLYIQGYDNGHKPRGRMNLSEADILYLHKNLDDKYWKEKLETHIEKQYLYYMNNFWDSENPDELLSDAQKQWNEGMIKAAEEIVSARNSYNEIFASKLSEKEQEIILQSLWEAEDKGLLEQYRKDYPSQNPPVYPGDKYIEMYLALHLKDYDLNLLRKTFLEKDQIQISGDEINAEKLRDVLTVIENDVPEAETLRVLVKGLLANGYELEIENNRLFINDPQLKEHNEADLWTVVEHSDNRQALSSEEYDIYQTLRNSMENKTMNEMNIEIKQVTLEEILGVMEIVPEIEDDGSVLLYDQQRKEYIDNISGFENTEDDDSGLKYKNAADVFERLDTYINDYFITDMQKQLEEAGAKISGSETLEELCNVFRDELGKGNEKLETSELELAMGIVNPSTVIMPEKYYKIRIEKGLTINDIEKENLSYYIKYFFDDIKNPSFNSLTDNEKIAVLKDMSVNEDWLGEYYDENEAHVSILPLSFIKNRIENEGMEKDYPYFNLNNKGQKRHYNEVIDEYNDSLSQTINNLSKKLDTVVSRSSGSSPFEIIENEEKGRVNIRFNPAKNNPYFDDIVKELKEHGWRYAPSSKTWYPVKIGNSRSFSKELHDKYESLILFQSVTKDSNVVVNNPYEGIKFFDRNYHEAEEFAEYFSEHHSEISPEDAKTVLSALNHKEDGIVERRSDRLGLDADNNLVIFSRNKGEVNIEKTDLNSLLKIAKDMSHATYHDCCVSLEEHLKKDKLSKDTQLQSIFREMYENCRDDALAVRNEMDRIFEEHYKAEEMSIDSISSEKPVIWQRTSSNGMEYSLTPYFEKWICCRPFDYGDRSGYLIMKKTEKGLGTKELLKTEGWGQKSARLHCIELLVKDGELCEKIGLDVDSPFFDKLKKLSVLDSKNGSDVLPEILPNNQLEEFGYKYESVKQKKETGHDLIKPLVNGFSYGDDTVKNIYQMGEGVYQATLTGVESLSEAFFISETAASLLPESIKGFLGKPEKGYYSIGTSEPDVPYVLRELIRKDIIPPKDTDFVLKLDEYIKDHPLYLALEGFFPVFPDNFEEKAGELVRINSRLGFSVEPKEIGRTLIKMVSVENNDVLDGFLKSKGCTSPENTEKYFRSLVFPVLEKNQNMKIENKSNKKDGYPPRGGN